MAAIRGDLTIIKLGPQRFLLRDPHSDAVFELGSEERLIVELLDGRHTDAEIIQRHRIAFGTDLTARHLDEFIEQLRVNGLLGGSNGKHNGRLRAEKPAKPAPAPLSWRDPGMFLNSFFDLLVLCFGFILHPIFVLPVLALAVVAGAGLAVHFGDLLRDFGTVARRLEAPVIAIMLLVKIGCLDLARNLAFGMAVRRFGGRIRSFGLRLHRGVLPYLALDPGDSMHTMSDRGRNTMLAVRLWAHTAVASLAVLGWLMSRPGSIPHDFAVLLTATSLIGLFFQLNVLMKMDACLILSRALDMPDLYERARAETRAWLLVRRAPEPLEPHERYWFRLYGLASYVWTTLLAAVAVGGGLWIAVEQYGGAGGLVGAALVLRWYWEDIRRWTMASNSLNWIIRAGGKWYIRWPVRLAILAGLIYAAMLPYNYEISGNSRVVPGLQYGVRAQVQDEIVQIAVGEGDLVQAGDIIAIQSGRDAKAQVAIKEADLAQAKAELTLLVNGPLREEIAQQEQQVELYKVELAYQDNEVRRNQELVRNSISSQEALDQQIRLRDAADKRLRAAEEALARIRIGSREEEIAAAKARVERLEAELAYQRTQLALTEIKAPISGRIVTPHLEERIGQVAQEGELICTIQDTDLLIEVDADEAAAHDVKPGMPAEVRLWGLQGEPLQARVERVSQAASNGDARSDFAVRSDREILAQRPYAPTHEDEYHIRVYLRVEDLPETVVPGMTGYAKITVQEERLWESMARPIVRFFRTEVWSWLP